MSTDFWTGGYGRVWVPKYVEVIDILTENVANYTIRSWGICFP